MFSKYYQHTLQTLSKLKTINSVKNYCNQATSNSKFQEVEIEVPWGKICGKYWGPRDVKPIIAMHGIRDNARSFDPLASRLPENVSLFAMDLPGHGLSSWIPRGFEYTGLVYVQALYRVKEHFKIKKLKLLCHSFSGLIAFMYTSTYPNDVKYVIAFDIYKLMTFKTPDSLLRLAKFREAFFQNEKSLIPRETYTYEAAIKKMIKASKNSLDEGLCNTLIERGMTKQPDGTLRFNEDPRTKLISRDCAASVNCIKLLAEQIRCPYIFIRGDQFDPYDIVEGYYEALKVIEEHSEDFHSHSIVGNHHFHMSNPELVANIINPFILKYQD